MIETRGLETPAAVLAVLMWSVVRNDDGAGRGVAISTCTARYSDYRLFDTSVRILSR